MKFEFIDAQKAHFPIEFLCIQLGVSRSGDSAWKERPESKREQADRELTEQVVAVHPHSRGTYGSPRVHAELRARGRKVSRKRVAVYAGLDPTEDLPLRGNPLTSEEAARVLALLLQKAVTLGNFPPRTAAAHLLREALEGGEVSREELLRRVERFARVAVLRPDGYLAWARNGRTQQKVAPVEWRDGAFRAGLFELGRFYVSNGFIFRLANERLAPVDSAVFVEVYDDADVISRTLDGAEEAFIELYHALGQLFTHPLGSLAALRHLPAGVAALIASSPEYWERFRYMTAGEQMKVVARLTTNLIGLAQATLPGVARHRMKTAGVLGAAAPALAQHHALWGGPCAGARFAGRVGSARCSRMRRTPLGAVTYANTLKPASTPGTGQDVQNERPAQQRKPNPVAACAPSSLPPSPLPRAVRSPLFLSAPPPSGGATATIARTGKRYDQRYIGVTQVRDGKIVLHREYWNPSVVLEAFGDPGYLGETFNTSG